MDHNLSRALIFQSMSDNYVDSMAFADLLGIIDNIDSHTIDGLYYFLLYCGQISSDSPMLFAAYLRAVGWFLSLHEVMRDGGTQNYIAKQSDDSTVLKVDLGTHRLAIPSGLFLPQAAARECICYFSMFGLRSPAQHWIAYDDLGYELYADPD